MTWSVRRRDSCILCGANDWQEILDLGTIHVSAFPKPDEPDPVQSPLRLHRCKACDLVQLRDVVNPDLLYRTYWYRSGTNQTMRDALAAISSAAKARAGLTTGDTVIDIGSNDGTLLASYQVPGLHRVGFEPSNIALEAQQRDPTCRIVNDYFRALPDLAGKAKVVTSVAMFYDLEDPHAFIEDVKRVLAPGGVWIMQLAYLPYMLQRNAFDGICHEHLAYYSLTTLDRLLERHGLHVEDAELVDLNEGSIRLFVRSGAVTPSERLVTLRRLELDQALGAAATYEAFGKRVSDLRMRTISLLQDLRARGLVVHGYGASTKGNTLLQYFGIGPDLVHAIWERQSQKWGRETGGTRIPIVSEDEGRRAAPAYLFMLPWHFAAEFIQREADYLLGGGHFIVPLPEFRIV